MAKKKEPQTDADKAAAANTATVDESIAQWRADQAAAAASGPPKGDPPTGARSHPPA